VFTRNKQYSKQFDTNETFKTKNNKIKLNTISITVYLLCHKKPSSQMWASDRVEDKLFRSTSLYPSLWLGSPSSGQSAGQAEELCGLIFSLEALIGSLLLELDEGLIYGGRGLPVFFFHNF
jgi:hypothetical protein